MREKHEIFELSEAAKQLIENIQGGLIVCRYDPIMQRSEAVYISEGWTALTGYTMDELNRDLDGNPQALVYEEDVEAANQCYMEQISKSNNYRLQYRFTRKDGKLIWVVDKGMITLLPDGRNQNQSIITDITEIMEKEEALRLSEERFRIATKTSNAAVFEFDTQTGNYLHFENAEVIFGIDEKALLAKMNEIWNPEVPDLLRRQLALLYHEDDLESLLNSDLEVRARRSSKCEVRARRQDGSYIWCRMHLSIISDRKGKPYRLVGHIVNIDAEKKQTENLKQEARRDLLTGVYNKISATRMVEEILEEAPNQRYALFLLDIDDFKNVNDRLGHLFGDAVLMEAANRLKELFRSGDIIGRMGGDEFMAFMGGFPSDAVIIQKAQEIGRVFRHTYTGDQGKYEISCSIGIAFSEEGDDFNALFGKADAAMYVAKEQGKDRYSVYENSGTAAEKKHLLLRNEEVQEDSGKLQLKERIFELLYASVDFAGSVNMALSLLARELGAGRTYIMENTEDNLFSSCIYEWHSEDVPSNMERMQNIPIEKIDYLKLFGRSDVCLCTDVRQLPESIQPWFKAVGVTGFCQMLIREAGEIRGVVGYECNIEECKPSPQQLDIMAFATKVMGTFIIKKRADESRKLFNQNKMEALDRLPSIIYVIDQDFNILYVNDAVKLYYPDVELGQKCHKKFMQRDLPCENCPGPQCSEGKMASEEIYNKELDVWVISNASEITWSGRNNMRLICCLDITKFKKLQ